VAVVGPGHATAADKDAEEVGKLLANRGAIVVCGGLGGVMEAACKGAFACGGQTIGFLPGTDHDKGNSYLSVELPTGLGELRNGLVVGVAEAVIAVGGSWGTLSEIALAVGARKPTVVLHGWKIQGPLYPNFPEFVPVDSAEAAVTEALARIALQKERGAR
jgi:uncharacterized protein (TIGR00725 family)